MKIVIDLPSFKPGLAALEKLGGIKTVCLNHPDVEAPARALDPADIRDADALFCTFLPTNHAEMRSLKWVQISSTGYEQVVGVGLTERGVRVTNGRGCFDVPIAEWNLAMMVMLTRNVRQMIRNQDAAVWDQSTMFQREIRGLTVGLWGYGGIARETARLARNQGLQVHVYTRSGVRPRHNMYTVAGTGDPDGVLPHRTFSAGQEIDFLKGLDFLVVSVPQTTATKGIIGERELRALPPTAYVLNPARGPIIQEAALLRALKEKWIAGAALDTHYQYPLPPEHPLWRTPNVILTPHISGSSLSPHFEERLWDLFVQNAGRFAGKKELLDQLTPAELSGK